MIYMKMIDAQLHQFTSDLARGNINFENPFWDLKEDLYAFDNQLINDVEERTESYWKTP